MKRPLVLDTHRSALQVARSNNREGCIYYSIDFYILQARPLVC